MAASFPDPPKNATRLSIALMLTIAGGLTGCEPRMAPMQTPVALAATNPHEQTAIPPATQTSPSKTDEWTFIPRFHAMAPLTPEAKADRLELAQKVANPVSNLASLPIRFTYQKGVGPKNAPTIGMLVQPLIPFTLNADWNLIVQTNVPINYVGSVAQGVDSSFGLGDILQGFYIVPVAPSRRGWIFGFGPAFQWPTATSDSFGTGKWAAGPTAVLVKQSGGWTYGLVAHQLWSYAGDDDREEVSRTLLHPLVTYTFPSATSITFESDTTYDWNADQWTVPLQLSISQVVVRGRRPVQLSLAGRYYADAPDGGPEWGIRFSVTVLFPNQP